MEIGARIRSLRKQKGISQDTLASHLGVTYQSVSKWENNSTMPDITMLPIIARFFGVSIDYLLGFDLHSVSDEIQTICRHAFSYRKNDLKRAESILRDGLKRYPNDEIILNHLIYVLKDEGKLDETILISKALIETTRDDEIKYDAYRILLETYKMQGNYLLLKEGLQALPELYFTKLELIATLLNGREALEAALDQKFQSIAMAIEMLLVIVKIYNHEGDSQVADAQFKLAKSLYDLLITDKLFPESPLLDLSSLHESISDTEKMLNSI